MKVTKEDLQVLCYSGSVAMQRRLLLVLL